GCREPFTTSAAAMACFQMKHGNASTLLGRGTTLLVALALMLDIKAMKGNKFVH
ncbi:unnamed protein product, partial [Ilex paraguariensis]